MDKSYTSLGRKRRLKSAAVFDTLGDLDELNAVLGLVRAFASQKLSRQILEIQNDLIEVGGFLSGIKIPDLKKKNAWLAEKIKKINQSSIKQFSRPGQNKISAFLHLARALCRRLERRVIGLKKKDNQLLVVFLNSLSNYIFWLACREEKN